MRIHGTLKKWNDERGFGFIESPQDAEEIFVHISAFPVDGVRPRAGEIVSFERRKDSEGRVRAENIIRPGSRPSKSARIAPKVNGGSFVRYVLTAIIAITAGLALFKKYVPYTSSPDDVSSRPANSAKTTFRCDSRTHCSQMTSCAEARYFLRNCPGTKMDGNNDGEPCERQWCN